MAYPELASEWSREMAFSNLEEYVLLIPLQILFNSVSGSEDKRSDSGEESHTEYLPDHKNSSCPSLRLILVP